MARRRRRPVDPVTVYIAAQLRQAREAHGMTFDRLSERSGVPRATAATALSGDSAITIEVLTALCAPLGVDPARLMADALRHAR